MVFTRRFDLGHKFTHELTGLIRTGAQPSRLDSHVWEKFGDDGKMNVHSLF
jgi:hypothetical protein